MALLVYERVEIAWSLTGHGVPGTVEPLRGLQKKKREEKSLTCFSLLPL